MKLVFIHLYLTYLYSCTKLLDLTISNNFTLKINGYYILSTINQYYQLIIILLNVI